MKNNKIRLQHKKLRKGECKPEKEKETANIRRLFNAKERC